MKICNKCNFRIPENEWIMFNECGQCGNICYREI